MAYADTVELARILGLRAESEAQTAALQRVLDAAAAEIDSEVGYTVDAPAPDPPPALAVSANLGRAEELWKIEESPTGFFGFGEIVVPAARDTWEKWAIMLAPLKKSWGMS